MKRALIYCAASAAVMGTSTARASFLRGSELGAKDGAGSDGYWLPPSTSFLEVKEKVKGDDQAYWLPPASGAPAAGGAAGKGGKGGAMQPAPSSPYTSQFSVNPQSFYGSFIETKGPDADVTDTKTIKKEQAETGSHLKVVATGKPEILSEKSMQEMEAKKVLSKETPLKGFKDEDLKYRIGKHFDSQKEKAAAQGILNQGKKTDAEQQKEDDDSDEATGATGSSDKENDNDDDDDNNDDKATGANGSNDGDDDNEDSDATEEAIDKSGSEPNDDEDDDKKSDDNEDEDDNNENNDDQTEDHTGVDSSSSENN